MYILVLLVVLLSPGWDFSPSQGYPPFPQPDGYIVLTLEKNGLQYPVIHKEII